MTDVFNFGDPRRLASFDWLRALVHKYQSCSINAITNNEAERKRAERFINNKAVEVGEVIEKCCLPSGSPVLSEQRLINVLDQTTIEFASAVGRMKDKEFEMGRVGNGFQYGQNGVAGLFVREDNLKVLGMSSLSFYSDDVQAISSRARIGRDERPLQYRNSHKWTEGVAQGRLRAHEAAGLVHVIDREADNLNFLLDAFARPPQGHLEEDFIVRGKVDRKVIVANGGNAKRGKIIQILEDSPARICYWVKVTSDERMSFSADYKKGAAGRKVEKIVKRKGRKALLEVRAVSCYLDMDHVLDTKSDMLKADTRELVERSDLSKRRISYVQVREVDGKGKPIPTPKNKKDKSNRPINWLLMTTLKVETPQDILRIIDIYRVRFPLIEQLFRGTKSDGINIESAQQESLRALRIMSAMSISSSALVMKMIGARDLDEGFPIEDDFNEREIEVLELCLPKYMGETKAQANHHPKSELSWATWIIARMGGWKPGNTKRPPGPKTMQRGLDTFYKIYEGVALARGWE